MKGYVSWELFWKMITFSLIGLAVFVYSLITMLNKGSFYLADILSLIGIILGLLIFIYGIFGIKRHYKNKK